MKILCISGRNLASLAGEFCIDFEQEPLASSGLFAICGPTGSGKSTLLDALCLALYDATPRLLKLNRGGVLLPDVDGEPVAALDPRNLLRRGAAEAHAQVDFLGNDGVRYRARWSVRRARAKATGALQKAALSLHRLPDLLAIGGTKTEVAQAIEQRIGLSFEQFTRAVLLAQNEFSAFLKTEENERGELLETLTGSAVYSAISRRAYERHRHEQQLLAQLTARLADHQPLAETVRAELDAGVAAARLALAALEQRQAALEVQLRWHQDDDKLRQAVAQAEQALAASTLELEGAAVRRRALATHDAAQAALPLLAEATRLARQCEDVESAALAAATQLQGALATQAEAGRAAAAAAAQLLAAEHAQLAAQPDIDKAKALDAGMAALAPSHRQVQQARDGALAAAQAAQRGLREQAARLDALQLAQRAAAAWLQQHRPLEVLALQWPRWDSLLTQAQLAIAPVDAIEATRANAGARVERATSAAAQADATAQQGARHLQQLEAQRQGALATLAAFDADALREQRRLLDSERASATGAQAAWAELHALAPRLERAAGWAHDIEQARAGAASLLGQAEGAAAALGGALAQAERAAAAADLACAQNVEDLRATLAPDQACPVCGSAEHPYQHQNAQLHALLHSLRTEAARCRQLVDANIATQAAQRASLQAAQARLADVEREQGELAAAQTRALAAWEAHPLARDGAALAPQQRAGWLDAMLARLREQSAALDARERAAIEARQARDAAQLAHEQGTAALAKLDRDAAQARSTCAELQAELLALHARHAALRDALDALLAELDGAMNGPAAQFLSGDDAGAPRVDADGQADAGADGGGGADAGPTQGVTPAAAGSWKTHWRRDPAAFHAACARQAAAWTEHSQAHAARALALAGCEHESRLASAGHEQAVQALARAQAAFEQVDASVAAMVRERAALAGGRPVQQLEMELGAALATAKAGVAARQAAVQLALQAEAGARAALHQWEQRRASVKQERGDADAMLARWLDGFAMAHPELDAPASIDALRTLLSRSTASVAEERGALEAIDRSAAGAATIVRERQAQRAAHQRDGAAPAAPQEEVARAHAALLAERHGAHAATTALQLQTAQDEARRRQSEGTLAQLQAQALREQRWARMNELIGSADGKKFRNYAQQFTLDVLLGYANSHLAQLARRYRLERVLGPSGPSLALMVRDQDMGGEIRSVNSLSGGESFLVSLALALGLASLSSNRVRVESLFIDEGFGSLDSETLRVAMDALDGLQSMGRKVGVISHVQEMTDRIACKILVQPDGPASSSVRVQ
ncbi:MAG: AAA family ATPase [Pseudomonadota bacterium]